VEVFVLSELASRVDSKVTISSEEFIELEAEPKKLRAFLPVSIRRNEKRERRNKMWSDVAKNALLANRTPQPRDVKVLEIAKATVKNAEASCRRAGTEILFFDKRNTQTSERGVPSGGKSMNPSSDYQ